MSRFPKDPNTMTAAELNDWYERNVGYRPQVDEPSMTDAELRALCIGIADECEYHGEPIR